MIRDRVQFPWLLETLGLNGVGVEVGTYIGTYAAELLNGWSGVLHCVDPWCHQPGWQDLLNHDPNGFEEVYEQAVNRLHPFGNRCQIHRQTSVEGAKGDWAHDLDFVYLDADHRYEHVKADIAAWWPTIKPGGLLAGHDYRDGFDGHTMFGVAQAVNEFFDTLSRPKSDLWVTSESAYPTWVIRKLPAPAAP